MDTSRAQYPFPWLSALIISLFGLTVALFCLLKVWNHDAVEYAFVVPADSSSDPEERIESFSDILRSQKNHYANENGRIIIHAAVQYFCGIGGKIPFAIADGLIAMAFILLLLRISGASWRHPGTVLTTSLLTWMYLTPFFFDPPYQIGYLWVPTLICLFILLFNQERHANVFCLILLAILSFTAGAAHEGFSAGVAIGLAGTGIHCRFRWSRRQWIMAIFFVAGIATHLMSGGNITRMAESGQRDWLTIPFFLLRFIPMVYVYAAVLLWCRQCGLSLRSVLIKSRIWLWATAGYIIVLSFTGIIYAFSCAPANFFLLVLTLQALPKHRLRGGMLLAVALITAVLLCLKSYSQHEVNLKYAYIRDHYLKAPATGLVVLPYELYAYDYRPMRERYSVYTLEARALNKNHAPIRVYPQGLEQIPQDLDTNMILPFGPDGIIALQSRTHPRTIILHHRFGPIRWSRTLTFRPDDLDFVDTTRGWSAVVYINPSPTFKPVEVEIRDPQ